MENRSISDKLAIASVQHSKEREYWFAKMSGNPVKSYFYYDYKETGDMPHKQREMNSFQFRLADNLFPELMRLSKQNDYMLYMILVSGLCLLLDKYTYGGNKDIILGAPIYKQEVEGDFINTVLPLRNHLKDSMTFKELLLQVKDTIAAANKQQNFPIEAILEYLNMSLSEDDFPLFDIAILLENIHDKKYLRHINLNMIFSFHRTGEYIEGIVEYNAYLYRESTIKRMVSHFNRVLEEALSHLDVPVSNINILSRPEKKQLLIDFNAPAAGYPRDKTIHELFERQVEKTPDNTALFGPRPGKYRTHMTYRTYISYRELNEKANCLAHLLLEKGVQPDTIAGIMVDRSLEMIFAILGILKAGAAYLPLNPTAPPARTNFLLNESSTGILLTTRDFTPNIVFEKDIIYLEDLEDLLAGTRQPPVLTRRPTQGLAYVIYTSGSTGTPKGVPITHFNFSPLVHWGYKHLGMGTGDRTIQNLSYYFDWSVWEIFITLTTGAVLYIIPGEILLDAAAEADFIHQHQITVLHITPTQYSYLVNLERQFSTLKYLFIGAEKLTFDLVRRSFESVRNHCRVFNMYGPTEATIISAVLEIHRNNFQHYKNLTSVPIGGPVGNTDLLVLDKNLNLCPLQVPGELFIRGDGTASGYLNNPDLTAEKFDHDLWDYLDYHDDEMPSKKSYTCLEGTRGLAPLFFKVPGKNHKDHMQSCNHAAMPSPHSPIYRTGDLARWLEEATVEFLGRIDYQVKIRGFRIELGEIENQLLNQGAIKEAIVIAREEEQGQYSLCAYVVPDRKIQPAELYGYLSNKLPDYMIPAYFVLLDKMPLTPNGKLDRKALPEPGIKAGPGYMPPRNELEGKLVKIWQEILGIEKDQISINSDFFQLGGHSLKANILSAKIHKEFKVRIPLTEIFVTPTISELAGYIKSASPSAFVFIKAIEKKEYHALSSVQNRLYVLQQMDPRGIAYNLPFAARLEGDINKEKLQTAFLELIKRHESLRTSFHMVNNEPVQRVREVVEFEIEYSRVEDKAAVEVKEEYSSRLEGTRGLAPLPGKPAARSPQPVTALISSFIRPFDLSQTPLLRVGLINLLPTPSALRSHPSSTLPTPSALRSHPSQEGRSILMVDMHHIISDGTSTGVLVNEFMALYQGKKLPGLRLQYKDYAEWEKREKEGETAGKQQTFWLKEFAAPEDIPVLELPVDYPRPRIQVFEGSTVNFQIDGNDTRVLKAMALEAGATLFMVLLSLYNIFLSKLSGQEVIVVGTPTAGRPHADLRQVIGMFVNTLPLKNYPARDKSLKKFLTEVKEKTLQAFENQDYQYEDLVNTLALNRNTSRNLLFDTMFILQNLDIPAMEIPGLKLKPREYEITTAKFDLTFECIELTDHLSCMVEYSTALFAKETIQRFIRYLKQIISFVSTQPDTKLAEINLIPEDEKIKLVREFNDTAEEFPGNKTIYQLFEDRADHLPDHAALVFKDKTLTYRHFDESANRLANYLHHEKGTRPGDRVAVLMERSIELIVTLMGVMKAGCAYVPLDFLLSRERLRVIFNDASIGAAISRERFREKLTALQTRCSGFHSLLCLDDPASEFQPYPARRPGITGETNPAYVMYTSGSSGTPKGVVVEHRTIVNTLIWRKNFYQYRPGDVSLQNPPYFFDSSITDIFTPLLGGARLVLVAEEQRTDLEVLKQVITANNVSHFIVVPAFYNILVEEIPGSLENVKMITVAGEHFPDELVRKHFEKLPRVRIFNEYGPTENSVNTTAYELKPDSPRALIGKPISNVSVYILDPGMYLCPIGITGEMCLAGSSIARGYLNNPELTEDKFLTRNNRSYTSYKSYIPKRIYKTGDLGKWLPDGNLEFLGRLDTQVKIRGIRIEIGEIENQLMRRDDIKEAVVLAHSGPDGEKYLCAYIVPGIGDIGDNKPAPAIDLKEYLALRLPEYMIPSYFMVIDSIPFMPNGKINRDALPMPTIPAKTYTPPGTRTEEKLAEIWAEVLGIAKDLIGIDTSFFDLGGHSLRATVISSRIHKTLGVKIPLAEIFKTPFIRGLAQYIQEAKQEKYASIEPVEKKEYYSLSPAQQRLYLLHRMELGNTSYNLPLVVPFPGEPEPGKLASVFKELIQRHESLRTSFAMVNDMPVQQVHDQVEFEIENYQVEVKAAAEVKAEQSSRLEGTRGLAPLPESAHPSSVVRHLSSGFTRPFDLSQAPLLRVGLQRRHDQGHLLMIDMHHIISDGVSHVILTNEFGKLYAGIGKALSPLRLQYKDYSQWQNSQKQEDLVKEQEAYWLAMFSGEIPVLNLPTSFPRPPMQSFAGCTVEFLLTPTESQTIYSLAKETGSTLFMSILAIFSILLSKLSGQEDIIVGTPVGGRRHADLEQIVGMFVNTLAIRNRPLGEKRLNTFLKEVKEQTLQAFENQEYPFEELVEKAANRDTARNPLFDVMFNLLNQEEYTGDIQGHLEQDAREFEYKHRKGTAKFDLTLTALDFGERLSCAFEYCTKLFEPAAIDGLIRYFKRLLNLLPGNPNLAHLEIITEADKKRILYEFNDTGTDYPRDMTIHRLFEKQVQKTPDNIALAGSPGVKYRSYRTHMTYVSYRQLNENANQLAHLLIEKGVQPGNIVGIMMERSMGMVTGIFAILKAGGAYLPVDPDYPPERIDYMLKDSAAKILLTAQEIEGLFSPRALLNLSEGHNFTNDHLAYIIYTSGSTGKPKGVLLEHRAVINTLSALAETYPLEEADVYLLKTSYTFDVSVTELFGWFPGGGRLAILEKHGEKDPYEILTAIEMFGVTHINFVPSMFNVFVGALDQVNAGKLSSLRYIFLAGEAVLPDPVRKFRALNSNVVLENLYGPTETAIYASRYPLSHWDSRDAIPIGKPLPNVQLYVLTKYGQLQPIGVAGELSISGTGLARGYLNRPALTAEKFCLRRPGGALFEKTAPPGPPRKNFLLGGHSRCRQRFYMSYMSYRSYISHLSYFYQTGDLAKWLPDGNIEFLGRIDHQVKIRGFRIEPGEIENRLLEIHDVKEAVVIAREDNAGEKYLCAYVVPRNGKEIHVPRLKETLAGLLPAYMVPTHLVPLEKVPLTPSGKINRNALPEPVANGKAGEYAAPAAGTETILAELWSRVLGIKKENISIDANFFDLGGNSLKAAQLTAHIHRTFQVQLSLGEIFKTPTIRGEALTIDKTGKTTFLDFETVEKKEFYELSYHQRRLWIISRLEPDTAAYNMPERIRLTHKVDENIFKKVIHKILERHESLRTGFKSINKKPVQFAAPPHQADIPFKYLDLSAWEENQGQKHLEQIFAREAKTPFDLTRPPLLRFLLVKMAEEEFWMIFNMHHIITDGFSQEILKDEFMYLYERYRKGEPAELTPLAFQYKDFAAWQDKQMKNPEVKAQSHRFWKQILEKKLAPVALPVDSNLYSDGREGAGYRCVIPAEIKDRLNQLAKSKNTSLFILVLSLFNVFLSRVSGQENIRLGLPVSGRDHISLQNIVGFFVNTVILDTEIDNNINFVQFLEKVHGSVLEVLRHQAYPLELVLDDLNMKFPAVNVFFNMLNLSSGTLDMELDSMESYHTDEIIDVKFDFMIYISEYKNGIQLNCNYKKAMFKPSTISSTMEKYLKVIDFFSANPGKGIHEFKSVSSQGKKRSLKRN